MDSMDHQSPLPVRRGERPSALSFQESLIAKVSSTSASSKANANYGSNHSRRIGHFARLPVLSGSTTCGKTGRTKEKGPASWQGMAPRVSTAQYEGPTEGNRVLKLRIRRMFGSCTPHITPLCVCLAKKEQVHLHDPNDDVALR